MGQDQALFSLPVTFDWKTKLPAWEFDSPNEKIKLLSFTLTWNTDSSLFAFA